MDKPGIAFSLISVSSPNLLKADRETEIDFAHRINIEGAEIVKRPPKQARQNPRCERERKNGLLQGFAAERKGKNKQKFQKADFKALQRGF